jgi:predicted lipoprotein
MIQNDIPNPSFHCPAVVRGRRLRIFLLAAAFVALGIFFSCNKSSGPGSGPGNTNDSVLLNLGNSVILPSYQDLAREVNTLDSAITDFNANPNSTKLAALQDYLKGAYTGWEFVSAYDGFGPASAAQPGLAGLNRFPTSTTIIESNITAGNNNVNAFANATAKGFPALDYLLFGPSDSTLIDFTSDPRASNRKQYLAAVSADIKAEVNAAYHGWLPSGGNYIASFVAGTGNSISSSLGLLINSMVQDFEILKNDKFGIPLGKQPPGTVMPVLPSELEGYYGGYSALLASAQLQNMRIIFSGDRPNANGHGLQDYLIKVNAKYHGGLLSDTIRVALETAASDMQNLPDPLSAAIIANPAAADAVYVQAQLLVVLLKTDMPSSLGVLINYGDNDGD